MITVRSETIEDAAEVRAVNERAFGRPDEARLVDALRSAGIPLVSLVAVAGEQVVGHILFTPVEVRSPGGSWGAAALGPMAVLPEYQGRGTGSALVRAGLAECARLGHQVVFVLGHPEFYPRFGFAPARPLGLECEWDVPEGVFMVAELKESAVGGRSGRVVYPPEFGSV
jgi:putative acetyltransferase